MVYQNKRHFVRGFLGSLANKGVLNLALEIAEFRGAPSNFARKFAIREKIKLILNISLSPCMGC